MRLPSTLKGRLAAALAVAVAAPIVQAQTAQQLEERRLQYNEERRREVERSGAPGSSGSDGLYSTPGAPAPGGNAAGDAARAAALERTRRNYEKQPPLPAARNRLRIA